MSSFEHALSACCLAMAAMQAGALHAADGSAANFPTKPIRFIVHVIAGAGADISARAVAQKLGEFLGQQVVVDNRPGAGGGIGMELTARAPADGYTIALASATHTVNQALHNDLTFDFVKDFVGVSQITSQPYCLSVHAAVPARSVKELIELARARPGILTYGSSGTGGLSHLAGAMFASLGKISWIHVPYKGGAGGINDLIAGQITSQFTTIIGTRQHVKSGRLRWLAVSTATRSRVVPDLPTVAEAGLPGFEVNGWYGIVAPKATPRPVVESLNREIVRALKSPDVGERFASDGSEPVGSSTDEFSAHIKREAERWVRVTAQINMRAE